MSYSSEVAADGPLAYYRLGEASGTTMTDSSGNSHNGAYSGVTLGTTGLLTGDSDTAATFDGSTSIGVATYASWLNVSTAFSTTAWIKPTGVSGAQPIADRDSGVTGRVYLWRLNGNKLEFITSGGTVGIVFATSSTVLSAGTRYHVAATFDGSNIRLYINGTLDLTVAAPGALNSGSVSDLTVGASYAGSGSIANRFAGVLDEVTYFNTVLSGTRIAAHYAAGTTAPGAASGTASLSLTASGGAAARTGGTASLSLSASGGAKAATGGSASLSLTASGALVPPTPAAGAASLALTASGGTSGSPGGTASLSLTAMGTAIAVLAASGSATLTLTASGSAVMSAGGTATLTLSAGGVAIALFTTDTSNVFDGLDVVCVATVTLTHAPAAPPSSLGVKYDKAVPYPVPVMVGGRPT